MKIYKPRLLFDVWKVHKIIFSNICIASYDPTPVPEKIESRDERGKVLFKAALQFVIIIGKNRRLELMRTIF